MFDELSQSKTDRTSECSNQTSFTDLRLSNICSKLKAEAEEIRNWKHKSTIKNKFETKSNTEVSLSINSQKNDITKPDYEDMNLNSYSKYTAIRMKHVTHDYHDKRFLLNYSYIHKKHSNNMQTKKKQNENGSLKDQEMEYEMTHLMTVSSEKIKIQDLTEYEEKVASITNKIKIIVDKNRLVFQSIKNEFFNEHDKWMKSIENIKFLKDKLNLKESQFQKLREQLEILTTNYDDLLLSSRDINNDLSYQKDQIKGKYIQLLKELDNKKNELSIKMEEYEFLNSELISERKIKLALQTCVEKQSFIMKELKQLNVSLEDKIEILKNKLQNLTNLVNQKDENILELKNFLKLSKIKCIEAQYCLKQMELERKDNFLKAENETKSLENNHKVEKSKLNDKISELIIEFEKYSKISESLAEEKNINIINLENQLTELKQQKKEMIEYLYKLPTSSIKWTNFFQ